MTSLIKRAASSYLSSNSWKPGDGATKNQLFFGHPSLHSDVIYSLIEENQINPNRAFWIPVKSKNDFVPMVDKIKTSIMESTGMDSDDFDRLFEISAIDESNKVAVFLEILKEVTPESVKKSLSKSRIPFQMAGEYLEKLLGF